MADDAKMQIAMERAKRLKSLREMTGLSRESIRFRYNVSRGTLQNWESARFGGLTVKGANQIVRVMQAEGIQVKSDWLLYGIGEPPCVEQKSSTNSSAVNQPSPQAIKELLHFKQTNGDVIDFVVQDDYMSPYVYQSDLVAGIRYYQSDLKQLTGKVCIIQTYEHGTLVRKLIYDDVNQAYHLQIANLDIKPYVAPMLFQVDILSAAPIIWQSVSKRIPLVNYNKQLAHQL